MLWCHVLLFKLNIPFKVVSLFNVVPDTYIIYVLFIVVIFFNVVTPDTLNELFIVVILSNFVTPDTFIVQILG